MSFDLILQEIRYVYILIYFISRMDSDSRYFILVLLENYGQYSDIINSSEHFIDLACKLL